MLLIIAHILDSFWILGSFRNLDKGIYFNPEDETSYPTQYQEAFLKFLENEYCAKHWRVLVNKHKSLPTSNLIPSAKASGSCQSTFDPYHLSSDDEEYVTLNNVADTTPGRTDHAARPLGAARLHLNLPPEAATNLGQSNPILNDYHSDPMEIRSTFWLLDITDWCRQQEEMHSKYADLSNVAHDIFSIISHAVGAEASFSLGQDVIGWRQSKTTGKIHCEQVVVWLFARVNSGILAGADPELNTTSTDNDSEMKKEAEEKILHSTAKVQDILEMWQGRQNLRATQKDPGAQNKQIIAVGYISDTEEIVKALWSLFLHDGEAAFKLSERSTLPPLSTAKDLPGGWTQVLNVRRIRRINRHPVESDMDRAPDSISDTEDWLNWNGDLDNPYDSKDNCAADVEPYIEQDNSIYYTEYPEQLDVSASPNVPGFILPTRKLKRQAEKVLMTINAIETRRDKGVKKR